jgi:1,4-alpha-glucan branching enzyme
MLYAELTPARHEAPKPVSLHVLRHIQIITGQPTRFVIDAPHAQSVEISGNFTDWLPHALAHDTNGDWVTSLQLAAGIYYVSVRIDGGAWAPPPGLPIFYDEFGSGSGVFEVR